MFNLSKYLSFIVFFSFIFQYNFIFSANYLWLNYWTGASIRTSLSFISIFLAFIPLFLGAKYKFYLKSYVVAIFIYFLYGILIGLLNNGYSISLIAESIFWPEIIFYFFILTNIEISHLFKLIKFILIFSSFNAVFSILYFYLIRDQIAVSALVGGMRIVRIADLLAPLIFLLFICYNKILFSNKINIILILPILLLILLGMFRSVWVAFILSYVISFLFNPSRKGFLQIFNVFFIISISIILFEQLFEYYFDVKSVVLGRILAGVGTADSLGRISSTREVLNQFFENPLEIIFGAGFGKLVWFVNDFGDGEQHALQPLASLSNYIVIFIYQVGILFAYIYLLYILNCIIWIKNFYNKTFSKLFMFILFYIIFQWLTFPTTIHYPIALFFALFLCLSFHIKIFNPK